MSDHLAYDYDHSKATVTELTNKLHYLRDKDALHISLLQLDQVQRKWKLIASLEKHYALQREHLNINVKDYLHLCHERIWRNKATCPELRNILSQYDITYPDEPSKTQLLEVLDRNILAIRKINHCRETEKAFKKLKKFGKARKEAEKARGDRESINAVDEDIEDDFSDEDEKKDRKEVKGTPGAWKGRLLNPHLVYPALGLVSSAAMWFLK